MDKFKLGITVCMRTREVLNRRHLCIEFKMKMLRFFTSVCVYGYWLLEVVLNLKKFRRTTKILNKLYEGKIVII